MYGLDPYDITPAPFLDPCGKCMIKMCCTCLCKEKIRFEGQKVPKWKTSISTGGKRLKCKRELIS